VTPRTTSGQATATSAVAWFPSGKFRQVQASSSNQQEIFNNMRVLFAPRVHHVIVYICLRDIFSSNSLCIGGLALSWASRKGFNACNGIVLF
jgi:hypothetical protein